MYRYTCIYLVVTVEYFTNIVPTYYYIQIQSDNLLLRHNPHYPT